MKKFSFSFQTSGTISGTVQARNKREAIRKIRESEWDDLDSTDDILTYNFDTLEIEEDEEPEEHRSI